MEIRSRKSPSQHQTQSRTPNQRACSLCVCVAPMRSWPACVWVPMCAAVACEACPSRTSSPPSVQQSCARSNLSLAYGLLIPHKHPSKRGAKLPKGAAWPSPLPFGAASLGCGLDASLSWTKAWSSLRLGQQRVFLLALCFFKSMKYHLGLKLFLNKLGLFFRTISFKKEVKDVITFLFGLFQFRKFEFTFLFETILFRKQKDIRTACLFGTGPAGTFILPRAGACAAQHAWCHCACVCMSAVLHAHSLMRLQTRG